MLRYLAAMLLVLATSGYGSMGLVGKAATGPGYDPVDYLIITPDSATIIKELAPLAEKKTEKGLMARILTTDSIAVSYPGRDLAEKIRTAIRDFRINRQTSYVLLAGDLALVPSRKVKPAADSAFFSDAYYECLDGTWDENGDGLFANEGKDLGYTLRCRIDTTGQYGCELVPVVGGFDLDPDIVAGRLPFSNTREAAIMVGKTLQYEYNPPLDRYSSQMLFLGHRMFSSGTFDMDDGSAIMRSIKSIYDSIGSAYRQAGFREIYEDRILSSGPIVQDSIYHTPAEYVDYLSQGNNFVFWIGHGSSKLIEVAYKYRDFFKMEDVALLTGKPSNFVTISCQVMKFENGQCIAKSLLAHPSGGAVTFTGASEVEYIYTKAAQIQKAAEWMSFRGVYSIAKAYLIAARDLNDPWGFLVYQFWGDPELSAWNRPLTEMDRFQIQAERSHGKIRVAVQPVTDSIMICLYKPGSVFMRGYAQGGQIEFADSMPWIDSIRITASARNSLQTTAFLVGGSVRIHDSTIPLRVLAVSPSTQAAFDIFGRRIALPRLAGAAARADGVYFLLNSAANRKMPQRQILFGGKP